MKNFGRRSFLKTALMGAASASFGLRRPLAALTESGTKKGDMVYRRLGRTELLVSEISLGGSPVPDWTILLEAVEKGVNYIDTSFSYMNGNSERTIGRLFKTVGREKVYVGTKFRLRGTWDETSIIKSVDGSLKRLETDYIDVLLIHGADNADQLTHDQVLNAYEKLKKDGKFRFTGLSCHSNHHEVVTAAVKSGHYDVIQLGYNVFDIKESDKQIETYDDYLGASGTTRLISLAKSKDVGIIAMKTLKVGGRRQDIKNFKVEGTTLYQAMLKWVLSNPKISSAVIEMLTFEQLEEDLAVTGSAFSEQERKALFAHVALNAKDYCRTCMRCQAHCPGGIQTAEILRYLAYHESYGKTERARNAYARLTGDQTVLACMDCGTCEHSCPYSISVRKRIRDAHTILG